MTRDDAMTAVCSYRNWFQSARFETYPFERPVYRKALQSARFEKHPLKGLPIETGFKAPALKHTF